MSVILDSWAIEMQFSAGVWTDVTDDVVISDIIRCEYGISNNSPTDRVARTGRMQYSLDNSTNNSAALAGYYSPGHTNCRSGFETGIPVRIRFTYDYITITKFYGKIAKDGITPTTGIYGERKTKIVVLDWMNQAATHEIFLPEYTTNKRIDEIVPLIVAGMPLAPLATNYMAGNDTFVSVFDTVREKTSVMSEFNKLALSEYGYIYIRHTDSDEILTVENRNARSSINTDVVTVPLPASECGFLLKEDGGYLLQENDSKLILDVSEQANYFTDTAAGADISYGNNMFNYITVTSYPRKFDTAATVLYSLNSAMSLAAGETRDLVGNFRDPMGGAWRVAGKTMVSPVSTTDYLMNTLSSGSGVDKTGSLSVTCTYGANAASYALTNNGTATYYVTKLQARGLGIYLYDPITYTAEDATSQTAHGLQPLNISMTYQDNADTAEYVGAFELLNLRNPRLELDRYPFWANRDGDHMMAFIAVDMGDRIHFTETQTGFDRDRYIDGIQFEVHPNKVVKCIWLTRFVSSLTGWYLGITGSTELDVTTILG